MCKNQFPKSNLKRLLAAATTVTAATKENEKRKYKKKNTGLLTFIRIMQYMNFHRIIFFICV